MDFVCPRCQSRYQGSERLIGKEVRCKNAGCQHVFKVAPADAEAALPPERPAVSLAPRTGVAAPVSGSAPAGPRVPAGMPPLPPPAISAKPNADPLGFLSGSDGAGPLPVSDRPVPPALPLTAWQDMIQIARWRAPSERAAAVVLSICAVPPLLWLLFLFVVTLGFALVFILIGGLFAWLISLIAGHFAMAYWKGNAVLVSAQQYPEIDAIVAEYSARLGITRPPVYIVQHSVFNAFAQRLAGRHVVVLYSEAIWSVSEGGMPEDVAFLIGHELGHIAAGHLSPLALWRNRLGGWFVWALLWHSRQCEITSDRLALACCRDVNLAVRVLVNMTVGKTMAGKTNVPQLLAQWNTIGHEFFVHWRSLYLTHPYNLYRVAAAINCAREHGMG